MRYVAASPVPLIFPCLSRANSYASLSVLVVLKVILRVSGRVLKLSSSRIFLRLHILVILCSNLVANEDYTFIGNRKKTLKERGVFLFSWFTSFHFSYKVVQRAFRVSSFFILWRESSSEADKQTKIQAIKVRFLFALFAWFIVHLDFLSPKKQIKNEACSYFLVSPPSICQLCGSLYSKRSL